MSSSDNSDLESISSEEDDIALLPREHAGYVEPETIHHGIRERIFSVIGLLIVLTGIGAILLGFTILIATGPQHGANLTFVEAPFPEPKAPNLTNIWLGNGCFWERQYAYVMSELDPQGVFKRGREQVTSLVGYAGSLKKSDDHLVCYHHYFGNQGNDYNNLGHTEVVRMTLDDPQIEAQFSAVMKNFFGSFTKTTGGYSRPDQNSDLGGQYRSVIGIPGGTKGALYPLVTKYAPEGIILKEDLIGSQDDAYSTVFIHDTLVFPFYVGEMYHQFHNHFAGPGYGQTYNDLRALFKKLHKIGPTGCPE